MNTHHKEGVENRTNTKPTEARVRPRWACRVRNMGEDVAWACDGWAHAPRIIKRSGVAAAGAAGAKALGADDVVASIVELLAN